MGRYLGIDCSTQSISAVVIETDGGEVLWRESIDFGQGLSEYGAPRGFVQRGDVFFANPMMWLDGLDLLLEKLQKSLGCVGIVGVSGAGQQHGSVYLNGSFDGALARLHLQSQEKLSTQLAGCLSRAESPIWMDQSTARQCVEIRDALPEGYALRVSGSDVTERFTGPQIRKFYQMAPKQWEQTQRIHLVSSFLCSVLTGRSVAIDCGDGAGMNLMDLARSQWDQKLLDATAKGLRQKLPSIAKSSSVCGRVGDYFVKRYGFDAGVDVVLFTGDNPSSLIGCGGGLAGTGVISLGTSDTFFGSLGGLETGAKGELEDFEPSGYGHVFGNPAGGLMSLVCFSNGSLAREWVRDALGLDWAGFSRCLEMDWDATGRDVVLPFLVDEITPRIKAEGLMIQGSQGFKALQCKSLVKCFVACQFLHMKKYVGQTCWDRLILTGGASDNDAMCQMVADIFEVYVKRLASGDSVALGACLRAAEAVGGFTWEALFEMFCRGSGDEFKPRLSEKNYLKNLNAGYQSLLNQVLG